MHVVAKDNGFLSRRARTCGVTIRTLWVFSILVFFFLNVDWINVKNHSFYLLCEWILLPGPGGRVCAIATFSVHLGVPEAAFCHRGGHKTVEGRAAIPRTVTLVGRRAWVFSGEEDTSLVMWKERTIGKSFDEDAEYPLPVRGGLKNAQHPLSWGVQEFQGQGCLTVLQTWG